VKKIVNDPDDVVRESLEGVALAHPELTVHFDPAFVARADAPVAGKVAVVSGGGSGHEPMHTGFVGPGMLDAAVPGAVFTSPTPDAVLAAIEAVDGGAGVLTIVKNYTGDVLNFELAGELAAAAGRTVASVLVDDDVAVQDSTFTAGRRGIAGAVLVEKIAGAAAARGDDLAAVTAVAQRVTRQVRSMGVALAPSTPPHTGVPSFALGPHEVELGVGIHGEPGRARERMAPADELVAGLVEAVLADGHVGAGDTVLLLVNGLGGTPLAELYIGFRAAHRLFTERGITIARRLVGNFTTAVDMQGLSVSVLRLDDELVPLWDAPVATTALHWGA
jgi:dihydroxyacetone kinase-like protein